MKKVLCALLSLCLLLPTAVVLPQPASAALSDGRMIYYEDFDRADSADSAATLSALGWTLSEDLNKNTARYSIQSGRLVCDNLTATVGTSVDSYVTVLDNAAMSEVARGDYTISYQLRYLAAENANRYAAMIYNYNGYQNYNSVHIRIGGTGNNQVRAYGSTWATYDDPGTADAAGFLASNGTNAISRRLFGKASNTTAPYALTGETLTVVIHVDADRGPTVVVNGMKLSEANSKCRELFLSSREYGSAIALKTSLKVRAEIDNVAVWTGLGEMPANKTVTYVYPTAEDHGNTIRVMSLNTLYSNSGDKAFADGFTRGQHMASLISGVHPDVVGLQERTSAIKSAMTNLLSACGYAAVDEYRTDTTKSGIMMETPIFYNTEKYELVANSAANSNLAHGNFIYSASYQTSGKTIGASSTYTKSLAWGVLRNKETGQLFLAMNTHQAVYTSSYSNYTSADAVRDRILNARQALETLEKVRAVFGPLPTFYTGDFNMRHTEESYRLLETEFSDAINFAPDSILFEYSMSNDSGTITDPNFLRAPNAPIDHIFFTPASLTPYHYNVLNDCPEMMIATDHLGLVTDFTVAEVAAPEISHKTGIYSSLQNVSMRGTGTVYYTLDGSDPRTSPTREEYTGMRLQRFSDTYLRCCSYENGIYSPVASVTLFFGVPFVITEAIKNTSGNDLYEGLEIMNVSSVPLDLYDFRLWEYTDTNEATVKNVNPASVTMNMRVSERPGEYVVEPGEVVYLVIVFSEQYTIKRKISSSQSVYLVEVDENCTPTYRTDYWSKLIAYDKAGTIDADRIIPVDRTARAFGYTASGTAVSRRDNSASSKGSVSNLSSAFNLGNAVFNRVYVSLANAANAGEAFCIADLDSTGKGTTMNGSTPAAKEGGYNYLPDGDKALLKTVSFTEKSYSIGSLNSAQQKEFMYFSRSENYKFTSLPGDADSDRTVDSKDLALLRRYFAQYDYTTGSSPVTVYPGADANLDREIDTKDLSLIRKYMASYDYTTGTSSVVLGQK